ncbi:MAG TPA: hypothetical protein VIG46_04880 [Candidatus Baltobacteraceae bacterium]
MRISQRTVVIATWIAAVAALAAGYARIELHEARRIGAAETQARLLETSIGRSREILRDRVALRAARKNIVSDIAAQSSREAGADTGPLLRSLDHATRDSGIAIVSVESDGTATARSADGWLRTRKLKLVVRGSFDRFLSFLPALSKADPLIFVRDIAIVPVGGARLRPSLAFTVGVDAYTVRAPLRKE